MGERGYPKRDEKFEEGLSDIRHRIQCQQQLKEECEGKHKAAFLEAIHDNDSWETYWNICMAWMIRCQGNKLSSSVRLSQTTWRM